MARTDLSVVKISRAGVFEAGSVGTVDGHMFANDGEVFVEVQNTNATIARTVTFITGGTQEGLAVADVAVSIPAASRRLIGPFPSGTFNQTSGADRGKLHVDYDAAAPAELTTRVYRL